MGVNKGSPHAASSSLNLLSSEERPQLYDDCGDATSSPLALAVDIWTLAYLRLSRRGFPKTTFWPVGTNRGGTKLWIPRQENIQEGKSRVVPGAGTVLDLEGDLKRSKGFKDGFGDRT